MLCGQRLPLASIQHAPPSLTSSTTTTTSASTARSAMSPPTTSCSAWRLRYGPNGIANSKPHGRHAESDEKLRGRWSRDPRNCHASVTIETNRPVHGEPVHKELL